MIPLNKKDLQCVFERKMDLQKTFEDVPAMDAVIRYVETENQYLDHEQCEAYMKRLYTAWTALDNEDVCCLLQHNSVSAETVVDHIFHASSVIMTDTQQNACLNAFLSLLEEEVPDETETIRRAEMAEQELKGLLKEKIESFTERTLKNVGEVLSENSGMIEELDTEDWLKAAGSTKEEQFFLALSFYVEAANGNVPAEWLQPEMDVAVAASLGRILQLAENGSAETLMEAIENRDVEFWKRILKSVLLILLGIAFILLFMYGGGPFIDIVGEALLAHVGSELLCVGMMIMALYLAISVAVSGGACIVIGMSEIWNTLSDKRGFDSLNSTKNKVMSKVVESKLTSKSGAGSYELDSKEAKA